VAQWIVKRGDRTLGPFDDKTLRKLASDGRLKPTDLISRGAGSNWVPAAKAKGLFQAVEGGLLHETLPPIVPVTTPVPSPLEKTTPSTASPTDSANWVPYADVEPEPPKLARLIECPDCGKEVSIRAMECPNCGCPMHGMTGPMVSPVAHQASTQQQLELAIKRTKDFSTPAVITLVLYLCLWLPGVIANALYLQEANKIKAETGHDPAGRGCLFSMFLIFVVAPAALIGFGILLVVLAR